MKFETLFFLFLLSISCKVVPPASTILIKNVKLIDGTGSQAINETNILIENGLFKEIGKGIKKPKNAQVIDGTGKTAIPGLFDMHGHLYGMGKTQKETYPKLYLANGVTNVCLLYTSPSPRDATLSRMPSSA